MPSSFTLTTYNSLPYFTELIPPVNKPIQVCRNHKNCASYEICDNGHCINACKQQCISNKCTVRKLSNHAVKVTCIKKDPETTTQTSPNIGKTLNPKFPDVDESTVTIPSFTNSVTNPSTERVPLITSVTSHTPFRKTTIASSSKHPSKTKPTPPIFTGFPFTTIRVTTPTPTTPGKTLTRTCTSSVECQRNQACLNNKCANPCNSVSPCSSGFICQVVNHRISCQCPTESTGNSKCAKGNN